MSLLLDKRELKKAAKELSVVKLQEVIDVLNSVLAERQEETEFLAELQEFVKAKGYTLEQLGYKRSVDGVISAVAEVEEAEVSNSKRPVKPKYKTINPESQYFYVENGNLQLLKTHTMKKSLNDRGIPVMSYKDVEAKYQNQIAQLLEDAGVQALANFNTKVDVWNEWAAANNEEILEKR